MVKVVAAIVCIYTGIRIIILVRRIVKGWRDPSEVAER